MGTLLSAADRPVVWKAINYAPRGHAYFRMLLDWYTIDAASGRQVRTLVAEDLSLLEKSGFNALHLYLWDQPTFTQFHRTGASKQREPAGFSYPDPSISPGRQWEALREFVALAEVEGLWVIPHLVHTPFDDGLNRLSPAEVEQRAEQIGAWAGRFVDYLVPHHQNILAWGALYALEPAPGDDPAQPNPYSLLWRKLYASLKTRIGAVPLVTYLAFPSQGADLSTPGARPPAGILTGYRLNVAVAKERYASMKRHLRFELGRDAEPDVVYTYLFGPDTADLEKSLGELTTGEGAVPADRLFLAEFGISAPFGAARKPVLAFGENGSPTTDLEGQAVWLHQCLCTLRAAGVSKSAYWTLYDAPELWSSAVWGYSAAEVALNGHWGLAFDAADRGFKPAWEVLRDTYTGRPPHCDEPLAAVVGPPDLGGPVRFASRPQTSPEKAAVAAIEIASVVSSANFKPAIWYPGSLLTLFVSGLQDIPTLWQAGGYPLPFSAFGVRVEFQGFDSQWRGAEWPAALLAAAGLDGRQQINVQVPWELLSVTALRLSQGDSSAILQNVSQECCGFFRNDQGHALAWHEANGEPVTLSNPALPGELVRLYVTNLPERPSNPPATGATAGPPQLPEDVTVKPAGGKSGFRFVANGTDAAAGEAISDIRLAPDAAGLFQMRLKVPPITSPQRMEIYYGRCYESFSKYSSTFPCLGGFVKNGTVFLPVAPIPGRL